ncbi:MAG: hypothetical protein IPK79_01200 [Vampirovibrionales bacterium]|nr:hypothetical protein [Vampirovibrionales bacterium]
MIEPLDPRMIGPISGGTPNFVSGGFLFRAQSGEFYTVSAADMAELFGGGGYIPSTLDGGEIGGDATAPYGALDGGEIGGDATAGVGSFDGGEIS